MDTSNVIPTTIQISHLPNVRASARIKAKKEIRPSSSKISPVRKKQKVESPAEPDLVPPKHPARVRGRRGLLKSITEMPLDVLFEIFGHLGPQDVLHVSQANKALHSILKSPSASAIWISALSNAKPRPPPCPPDMTSAQYVHLLYSTHCSLCASRHISVFHYEMRVKACKSCLQIKYYDHYDAQHDGKDICITRMVRRTDSRAYDAVCLKSDHDKVWSELAKLGKDENAIQQFIQERQMEIRRRKSHGQECTRWRGIQQQERAQIATDIRERRKNAIHTKIKSIGWGEELKVLDHRHAKHIPGLNITKDLTEKGWSTLEPVVIEYLTSHKEQRLAKERQRILTSRFYGFQSFFLSQNPTIKRDTTFFPNPLDLAMMEPIRSMIFDTPLDKKLDFIGKESLLKELATLFNQTRIELLVRLLPKPKNLRRKPKRTSGDLTRLQLAITFFRCKWCRDIITYPRILVHECLSVPHPITSEEEQRNDQSVRSWRDLVHLYSTLAPWNYGDDQVSFDDEISDLAATLIGICGEDPQTATMEHMDRLDVRLECVRCCHPSRGRLVMRWKLAIIHEIQHHYEEDAQKGWNKISQDDVVKVLVKEEGSKIKSVSRCCQCEVTVPGRNQIEHVQKFHKNNPDNLDLQSKFYIPLDIPFKQPPYAVRIH